LLSFSLGVLSWALFPSLFFKWLGSTLFFLDRDLPLQRSFHSAAPTPLTRPTLLSAFSRALRQLPPSPFPHNKPKSPPCPSQTKKPPTSPPFPSSCSRFFFWVGVFASLLVPFSGGCARFLFPGAGEDRDLPFRLNGARSFSRKHLYIFLPFPFLRYQKKDRFTQRRSLLPL